MVDIEPLRTGCTMRLILVRHGAPEARAAGCCYGRTDFTLSDEGYEQIRRSLDRLQGLPIHALYTSPLARALGSAHVAEDRFGLRANAIAELCEMNFGLFEGLTYEEIEREYPNEYKLWMEQPAKITFPGGENLTGMKRRVLNFIASLEELHINETVLIVSHAGVNRIVLANALGFKDEAIFGIPQEYGAMSIIDYFSEALSVRVLGCGQSSY